MLVAQQISKRRGCQASPWMLVVNKVTFGWPMIHGTLQSEPIEAVSSYAPSESSMGEITVSFTPDRRRICRNSCSRSGRVYDGLPSSVSKDS